jgi:hypothetical protein
MEVGAASGLINGELQMTHSRGLSWTAVPRLTHPYMYSTLDVLRHRRSRPSVLQYLVGIILLAVFCHGSGDYTTPMPIEIAENIMRLKG